VWGLWAIIFTVITELNFSRSLIVTYAEQAAISCKQCSDTDMVITCRQLIRSHIWKSVVGSLA